MEDLLLFGSRDPSDRDPPETPKTETSLDRDPPWTEIPWTETLLDRDPSGQTHPLGQRLPPRQRPPGQRDPRTVTSGWYASYWNAFLFEKLFSSHV